LRLVGFQPLATLQIQHRIKHSYLVYPAERLAGSSSAYAALLKTMLARQQMGICRMTTTSGVRMQALVPSDGQDGMHIAGLYLVPLPFADELRKSAIEKEKAPSPEQVNAARAVIQGLSVRTFNPTRLDSPAMQHYYAGLEALALGLDTAVPYKDLKPDEARFASQEAAVETWRDQLPELSAGRKRPVASATAPASKKPNTTLTVEDVRAAVADGTLSKMTVPSLKDFLKSQGLNNSGIKTELLERASDFVQT